MLTSEKPPLKDDIKKAFARDISAFQDTLSSSKEALSSMSPRLFRRKQTNLIHEARKFSAVVDLGVDLGVHCDAETEEATLMTTEDTETPKSTNL